MVEMIGQRPRSHRRIALGCQVYVGNANVLEQRLHKVVDWLRHCTPQGWSHEFLW